MCSDGSVQPSAEFTDHRKIDRERGEDVPARKPVVRNTGIGIDPENTVFLYRCCGSSYIKGVIRVILCLLNYHKNLQDDE